MEAPPASAIQPELPTELHRASARGSVEQVRNLLSGAARRMCLIRDSEGLTPLHLAAKEGKLEVMRLLLEKEPDAARLKVGHQKHETILHLCVKNNQLDALKLLLLSVPEFVNSKDDGGNTVLHLAVEEKQVETTELLLGVDVLKVNALNNIGMTAMDVLIRSERDIRDSVIAESLQRAGGTLARASSEINTNTAAGDGLLPTLSTKVKKKNHDWLDKKKNALMLVATLNATMAFQIGVNPPGGVWQDDNFLVNSHGHMVGLHGNTNISQPVDSTNNVVLYPHQAGCPILERNAPYVYKFFYISNSIGFVSSLAIIFMLMSGYNAKNRFFMWLLTVISHIAIFATASTYFSAVIGLTALGSSEIKIEKFAVFVWCGLMAFVIIFQAFRLFVKLGRRPPQELNIF